MKLLTTKKKTRTKQRKKDSLSSMADLFSAWLSMSLENHSLNSSWESNSVGMMKCSRAHSWETVTTSSSATRSSSHRRTTFPERETHAQTRTHLSHGVLDGRPREKQSVSTLELQQDFPPNAGNSSGKETTASVQSCWLKMLIHFASCKTLQMLF